MARRVLSQAALRNGRRIRIVLVCLGFLCVFLVILIRLYILQILEYPSYRALAEIQQHRPVRIPPHRGDILDRNGVTLATSAHLNSIWLDRRVFGSQQWEITRAVAKALGVPRIQLASRLKDVPTPVAEKISPERAQAILADMDRIDPSYGAVSVRLESKRFCPKGALAAHLLGFCAMDERQNENVGIAGLELAYDEQLGGKEQVVRLLVNHWGQAIEPIDEEVVLASHGNSLELTLDAEIQHFAESALARQIDELQAKAGACVVMDPKTGDILAMASYPSFVPVDPKTRLDNALRNRAMQDALEPGSVMKIFTYATALEFNLVSPTELVDCENGACLFHEGQIQRVIRDFHPIGVVPCAQAFAESSNIAAVKIGLRIAPRLFHEQLAKLGLVDKVGLGLPEKEGHLTDLRKWSYLTRTSVPFGYEISANSAQLLACASAIANGGLKMAPRLARRIISPRGETVQTFEPKALGRVFSEHTCQIMMELMEGVVQRGTGKAAAVEGYRVAGKTGTAKKHDPDNRRYVASFIGFLPVCDPRLAIFCWIDEPATESDEYTGGRAAAPVFRAVAEQAVRLRGIRPDGALASPEPQIALDNGPRQPPAQAETRIKVRGVMPNLIGMTMREVQEALGALHEAAPETKLRTRFYGSGVVVRQDPQPETPLASQQQCSIHFSRRLNDGDRAAPLESHAPDLDKLSQGG